MLYHSYTKGTYFELEKGYIYRVLSGKIIKSIISCSGRDVAVNYYDEGDYIFSPLKSSLETDYRFYTLSPTQIVGLTSVRDINPTRVIQQLIRVEELAAIKNLPLSTNHNYGSYNISDCRLANFIRWVELRMTDTYLTQEQIGQFLGTTRAVVGKHLKKYHHAR
jgi:hypothetical protein